GGHEMLVPSALTLISADHIKNTGKLNILAIGDSNGAAANGWPNQMQKLLPYSTILNSCISGNTIGFDNLGQEKLNTLKNINRYLDEAYRQLGPSGQLDYILIGLGTNDTKTIFNEQQKEIPELLAKLLEQIKNHLQVNNKKSPAIILLLPPPVEEQKADQAKYGGSAGRLQINQPLFKMVAASHQAAIIDLSILRAELTDELTIDGIHLTVKAQFRVAAIILEYINKGKK
ncbi:MAG TPA: GDSL-type esterase/lipase family protein, partial [Chitinophagaceae bacterium]|nr:GDSL-type esterase/lipase family protein [Chitinophagaceae bacterium]